ncbi:MAG: ABC transporter substrate-binding protein, partial [Rhodospirillaceae bacterium]
AFGTDDIPLVHRLLPGQAHLVPQLTSEYLVANLLRPPFNDVRLRRALSLCLDRKLLADKVYKDGTVGAEGFVPPRTDNYHNAARFDFADWPMDKRRDEAKRLLAEAGYGPGKPLVFEYKTMSTTNGRRSSVTEAAMLKQCNMTAQILFMEPKVYYAALQQGDFTLGWAACGADYNDPYTFLYLLDSRAGAYNYQRYKNPAYDRLMDKAQLTLDLESRAAVLAEAEQIALNDVANIPLIFPAFRTLVAPYVRGYVENPITTHRTRWMSLSKPPS